MAEMDLQQRKNRILSPEQLNNIKGHKYSCVSNCFFDPYLQKWWSWLVEQCPLWLAPNLITFIGLIINILTTLILVTYSPDGKQDPPRWACFLCAVGVFIYQSLDAIDGKQARRTGSSTPLGDLFDHGCDAVSTICVVISACLACQLGYHPKLMFSQCFGAYLLFYCAHWQAYVTGTVRFSKLDVTEAQLVVMALHLTTAIFGAEIWSLTIPYIGHSLRVITSCFHLFMYVCVLVYHLCVVFQERTRSTVAGTCVLLPVIPISEVLALAFLIAIKSPTLYENSPVLYIITFGLLAAQVSNKLVIAKMAKSGLKNFDWSMLGPLLLALNLCCNNYFPEYNLLWGCLIWALVYFLFYHVRVFSEICDYLQIELFRIKPVQPRENGAAQEKITPEAEKLVGIEKV